MDDELDILGQIQQTNEQYAGLGLLPSEISGRDSGAFFDAMVRTPIMDWPGMYGHQNTIRRMKDDEMQSEYWETLKRERASSQFKLESVYENLRKQNFESRIFKFNPPN